MSERKRICALMAVVLLGLGCNIDRITEPDCETDMATHVGGPWVSAMRALGYSCEWDGTYFDPPLSGYKSFTCTQTTCR